MVFAHDTEITLQHVVALVNSAPGHGESTEEDLPTVEALGDFFDQWQWTGRRARTRAGLRILVYRTIVEQLSDATGIALDEIDPSGHREDEED